MVNNSIVIDTNVFISSIIGQYGYAHKIIEELVLTGEVKLCLSEAVLQEYKSVSGRERFKKIPKFVEKSIRLIDALSNISKFYFPQEKITIISDDPDNRILELAVEAEAGTIITGNTNDFNFKHFRQIEIKTPREYYEEYQLKNR